MDALLHDLTWVLPLRSDAATLIFQGFTALGYLPFYLLALPLGYWLWDKAMFTRLAVLIMASALLNGFLKDLFDDPRPAVEFALDGRVGDSFGLPSGHAQLAVATWFWLAYELRRPLAWVLASVVVLGICLSRLYLGVHDVEDVLAGALIGAGSLFLFAWLRSERLALWHDLDARLQIALLLALQPLLWLVWPEPDGPGAISAVGAFLIGWWGGACLERRHLDFQRHPSWLRAGLAAVMGVGIVFGILATAEPALLALGLGQAGAQWLQTAIMALFITVIAPWLFRTARLAH